jgi:predicted amidophosphoribosyltransferase
LHRDALQRRREGPRQAAGNCRMRLQAAEGLFDCRLALQGETVAIVDDVITTGSTMDAAALAVLQAGAARVIVLVVARTP